MLAGSAVDGGIRVNLTRLPIGQISGTVNVSVPKETAVSSIGFVFSMPKQIDELIVANSGRVNVSQANGAPLPGWLRYDPASRTFNVAAVPNGAFPLQVITTIGAITTTVTISERVE